jgi:type VII secretion-associated serine protease mycosin
VLTRIGRAVAACGLAGSLAAGGVTGIPAVSAATATRAASAVPAVSASPTMLAQGIGPQVRAAELPELREIEVPAAWRASRGRGVTVAVLDTGVDPGAPDLAGSVTTGPDFTQAADPAGFHPPRLHGTYIASLIAGHGSGPGRVGGVIGVAPNARVLSVRVILDDGEPGFDVFNENAGFSNSIPDGIRYAVRHGASVINMSLGSPTPTRDLRLAVGYAITHNVVVVSAAGNSGSASRRFTPYSYPASFTGVISVAAVGPGGKRAAFSDRNASVVISAPGVNVVGAGPAGTYLTGSGTSPASAFVAGVAALIRSKYPQLTPAQVTQALVSSVRRRPGGGYNPGVGFGEVDAAAALAAAGKLAAQHAAAGLGASAHFGARPGPIQVVHRAYGGIIGLGVLALTGAVGFVLMLVMLMRHRRRAVPPAGQRPRSNDADLKIMT